MMLNIRIGIYDHFLISEPSPLLTLAGNAIVIDQEKFYNYFPNKPANILYLLVPGFLTKIYSSLPTA
jgi:hypothetical protein